MKIVRTAAELRAVLDPLREGAMVGLVPTMGALHAGHQALLAEARRECGVVVASLFVNGPQFGDAGDLAAYPRDEAHDASLFESAGVDVLFAPSQDEMYPEGFATWIEPGGIATELEGEHRPGHFRGVATICVKLFSLVRPHMAYFGRKDAQQVAVVKQVVRDLNLDVEIRPVETVRDADGLALSSRNVRLSPQERRRALAIPRALATRDLDAARRVLAGAGIEPEYVTVAELDGPTLAIAARIGGTRLIDNVALS